MKIASKVTLLAVFLGLVTLSVSLVLYDNSKGKTSESTGRQLDKITSGEGLLKDFSNTSGENIIEKVEIQNLSFESQDQWDGFETVTINIEEFENAAANGNVSLKLFERNFKVQIKEISRLNGGKLYRYSGTVNGIPDSRATFYVCGELFCGSIEFEDWMYNIAVTSEINNGNTVYVAFAVDWKKDHERMGYLLNPLKDLTSGQETKNDMPLDQVPLNNCILIYRTSGISNINRD